jgi:signal transduction histidine kinase
MLTAEASTPVPSTAGRAPVLVVDDEYGPRESVAFTLSTEFEVQTAERAVEAFAKIREREFSAIVLDIRMPEMDGIRALEEIRKIDPLVSVIMLTGYGTLHTAQQAMLGGANQYLRKPPDIEELLAAVRSQTKSTAMRRHQARLVREAEALNAALKKEIERGEPQIWKGRASVELVHDLNNPLTVVIGYSTLLVEECKALSERDPELGKKLLEYASMVEKAAEYCHHLSENWRLSSRKMAEMAKLDLIHVARDVQHVIFFGNLAISITGIDKAYVLGSRFELMRVFQNIFKNALEAGAHQVATVFARNGNRVEVTITDNGPGMDAEKVNRAMRGGYTSKATGTGLGLGICRHLVTAHGGTFDLKSEPGQGVTVRLSFPAAAQS